MFSSEEFFKKTAWGFRKLHEKKTTNRRIEATPLGLIDFEVFKTIIINDFRILQTKITSLCQPDFASPLPIS
jgi:hypothetical protein